MVFLLICYKCIFPADWLFIYGIMFFFLFYFLILLKYLSNYDYIFTVLNDWLKCFINNTFLKYYQNMIDSEFFPNFWVNHYIFRKKFDMTYTI